MKELYLETTVHVVLADAECAGGVGRADARAAQILAYLDEHCAEATLGGVAAHFGFHPNTVASLLRDGAGTTFTRALRDARMRRARRLLAEGGMPVDEVARRCGYENPASFYRAFREATGETPGAYAGRAWEESLA